MFQMLKGEEFRKNIGRYLDHSSENLYSIEWIKEASDISKQPPKQKVHTKIYV